MHREDDRDPALVAAVIARSNACHAHHEAGHAVAAVAAGGTLHRVFLGKTDWSTSDGSADEPGGTEHETPFMSRPFVTFAGPWAEATWNVANPYDDDVYNDDFREALDAAWWENSDGDTASYEEHVELLALVAAAAEGSADDIARHRDSRAWEDEWAEVLTKLWPAICGVAELLIDGKPVTHEVVEAVLARTVSP